MKSKLSLISLITILFLIGCEQPQYIVVCDNGFKTPPPFRKHMRSAGTNEHYAYWWEDSEVGLHKYYIPDGVTCHYEKYTDGKEM